jgi:microcystin-dependent protein
MTSERWVVQRLLRTGIRNTGALTHPRASLDDADLAIPTSGRSLAKSSSNLYANISPNTLMSIRPSHRLEVNQPHNNMMPYLTYYFNKALQGIFPPRS